MFAGPGAGWSFTSSSNWRMKSESTWVPAASTPRPGSISIARRAEATRFLYFTNGAAVSEVEIDRLTGELKVTRVDILMDLGRSLHPDIDRGQVIGGFVQGMGWVTTEELLYSETGELLSQFTQQLQDPGYRVDPARLAGRLSGRFRQPDQPARQQGGRRTAVCARHQRGGGGQVGALELSPGRSPPLSFPGDERRSIETSVRHLLRAASEEQTTCRNQLSEEEFMSLAIAKARDGIAAGQSPFGAIIVPRPGRGGGDS